MKNMVIGLCLSCMLLVGCGSNDFSQNMRVASARAGGGIATKAILDEVPIDKYDETKNLTILVATDLKEFFQDGNIASLPINIVRDRAEHYLISKGWYQYWGIISSILATVEAQHVNVDAIGEDNIYLIIEGLDEVIYSAQTSRIEWRRNYEKPPIQ